jgi:hypothetical protein
MAVTQVNLSDQMAVFVQKTNIISGDLGDVGALTTSADSNAVVAINEIESNHNSLASTVSTIQTNLNNLDSDVGTRTSLITNDRTDLVTAINEVKADANGISGNLGSYLRSDAADSKTVGDLNFVDNVKATFGTGSDMSVFHDGSDGFIRSDVLNIQNAAGSTDYVHIDNSGNVGIGLTSGLDGKLHVYGNAAVGDASTASFSSFTSGGLDVAVGSGTKAFQVWDNNSTSVPRFTVERGGNVGIGTSSPGQKLEVLKAGGGTIRLSETSARYVEIIGYAEGTANGSTMSFNTIESGTSTLTERMRITGDGDVVIQSNASQGDLVFREGATNSWSIRNNGANGYLAFYDEFNSTERMHISNSGRVGIGNTSPNAMLHIDANSTTSIIRTTSSSTADQNHLNFRNNSGAEVGSVLVTTTSTSYNTSSDERLKENIETLQNGTELLKAMRAVTYNWKANGNSDTGFIAQEMNEVMPQAVSEGYDGMLSMDYGRVTPIIVAALQDALKRIDELEAKQCNCGGCS